MPFLGYVFYMNGVQLDKVKVEVVQYHVEQHKIKNYTALLGLKLVDYKRLNSYYQLLSSLIVFSFILTDNQVNDRASALLL